MAQLNIQKAAIKLLKQNINLRKHEKVVVVTDRKKCPVFKAVCNAVKLMKGNLTEVHITKNRAHSSPLPKLEKTFIQNDVIIAITDKSISHSPETRIARKKHGVRVISMVEVDKILFLKAIGANQNKIKIIGNKLSKKLKKCRKVRITTPSGTNLKVNVIKDAIDVDDGDSRSKGKLNNLPYGEVAMAPINIADGVVAIDFSRVNIKPKDHVKLILRKGKIIDYNNRKAKNFVEYLRKIDGEKALKVVELGLGTNPEHKSLVGKIIHDEKIIGSAHIAFGGFGNKRKCKIHEDVVLLRPTIFFDNKLVIEKGKIL
ncbi:MAG: aminopeptidase [Nanoarchaeota archaeon]|nr:aminopeptidase [Nanoarchaeota archaeon]